MKHPLIQRAETFEKLADDGDELAKYMTREDYRQQLAASGQYLRAEAAILRKLAENLPDWEPKR